MSQLENFMEKGKENLVGKLKKSLYGLKQSPRMSYQKFDTFVLSLGFQRCKYNHCVYFETNNGCILIIAYMYMICYYLGIDI